MKKILSLLVCVCVLLSAMVITASAAATTVVFEFGANGNAAHDDAGNNEFSSKTYTEGNYTLALTGGSKIYHSARDAKGNSALKLGTSSKAGTFQFEAPADVTSVIIKVAQYKSNTTKVQVNGTTYTITTASDNGAYTDITVDTSTTKAVQFETLSGGYRCMIDSITYVIADTAGGNEPTCEHTTKSAVPNGNETHKLVCDACSETVTPVVECTDADVNGKCDVCEGNVAIPVQDPAADSTLSIVDAAALGASKAHDTYTAGKYYIEGKIAAFQSNANATKYGNFYLADDAGNQILIYGLYSEDGEVRYDAMETKPVAGDTVKLYGVLGQYSGTAQMKSAWLIEHTPATTPDEGEDTPDELPTPDATNTLTIAEAVELGAAQANSAYTEDRYYVTGQVTSVTGDVYGNMYITDEDGNEIYIYGMYSADGEIRYDAMDSKPDAGDTVTVYTVVGNYNGTPQLKNVWLIEFTEGELNDETPVEPEADSVLTLTEAAALGLTKRSGEYTTNKYYVTGTITGFYGSQGETYGNIYIADEDGNEFLIYGTWEVLDEIRYDAMETKPVVGDTVTVYGVIGQYNGTAQMKNGVYTTAPVVDDDNNDDTTTDDTNTETKPEGDSSTTSPDTGDNMGAVVALAMVAGAALVFANKKR